MAKSRPIFSQKSSIVDIQLVSKCASVNWMKPDNFAYVCI